jgi:hypothetical protein
MKNQEFLKELKLVSTIKSPIKTAFFVPQHYVCYLDKTSDIITLGTPGLNTCVGLAVYNPSYNHIKGNYKVALAHLDVMTSLKSIKNVFTNMRKNDGEPLEVTLVGGLQYASKEFDNIIDFIEKLCNVSITSKLFPQDKLRNGGHQKLVIDISGSVDTKSSEHEIKIYCNTNTFKNTMINVMSKIRLGQEFDLEIIEFSPKDLNGETTVLGDAHGFVSW